MEETVRRIIAAVRSRGDEAVLEYTAKFGGPSLQRGGAMRVTAAEFRKADKAATSCSLHGPDLGISALGRLA